MAEPSDKQSTLGSKIFRETALQKMSSADDLDRYLQVTNPSAWVLIGAVAALLVAGLVWGMTASLPVRSTATGVVQDGQIVCFLPLDEGVLATTESKVTADGHATQVVSVDTHSRSQREVAAALGSDYVVESSNLSQWSYKVVVALPDELSSWVDGDDVPVQITTSEVAPLAYLFGEVQ